MRVGTAMTSSRAVNAYREACALERWLVDSLWEKALPRPDAAER